MRFMLIAILLLTSFMASSDDFSKTEITLGDIAEKIPDYKGLWVDKLVVNQNLTIYKQSNLFSMSDVMYRDVYLDTKSGFREVKVYDSSDFRDKYGFVTNKVRMLSGRPPVSAHDNEAVLLCRLENHVKDKYYEVSLSQIKKIRSVFPSVFAIDHLCVGDEVFGQYWQYRLSDFYDEYGNKL